MPLDLGSRFIPARAGNAISAEAPCWPVAVHPRACGERNGVPTLAASSLSAVHPRACGERAARWPACGMSSRRFIPARAGNAIWRPAPRAKSRAIRFIPARAGNAP